MGEGMSSKHHESTASALSEAANVSRVILFFLKSHDTFVKEVSSNH